MNREKEENLNKFLFLSFGFSAFNFCHFNDFELRQILFFLFDFLVFFFVYFCCYFYYPHSHCHLAPAKGAKEDRIIKNRKNIGQSRLIFHPPIFPPVETDMEDNWKHRPRFNLMLFLWVSICHKFLPLNTRIHLKMSYFPREQRTLYFYFWHLRSELSDIMYIYWTKSS